jgi:hypothetical protein
LIAENDMHGLWVRICYQASSKSCWSTLLVLMGRSWLLISEDIIMFTPPVTSTAYWDNFESVKTQHEDL